LTRAALCRAFLDLQWQTAPEPTRVQMRLL